MFRRLRFIVPVIQVIGVVVVFVLDRVSDNALLLNALQVRSLLLKVSYPLVFIWFVIGSVADSVPASWSPHQGFLFAVIKISVGAALVLSLAAFWYLVMVEIEMRMHGHSMLRFSGLANQCLLSAVIFVLGIVAIIYAYLNWSLRLDRVLGTMILVAWGLALIGMATYDLIIVFRTKPSRAATAGHA